MVFLSLCPALRKNRESAKTCVTHHFSASHYEDALKLSGCTTLCERRDLLCAKTFEKIKEPGSRLHHLMAPTRARTHGCSLRFNDRPSLTNVKQNALRKVSSLTCALKLMDSGWIFSNIIICSKVFITSNL